MIRALLILILLFSSASAFANWSIDGIPLDAGGLDQKWPQIVEDGAGGVIVSWTVEELSGDSTIRMQRMDAEGNEVWASGGVVAFTGPADLSELPASLIADGFGGAITAWEDHRVPANSGDIYAQRVSASGNPLWGASGVAVCTDGGSQKFPQVTDDGSGGAYVVWTDDRHGAVEFIYVRKVDFDGTVQWAADGEPVVPYDGFERTGPHAVSLGLEGVALVYVDRRFDAAGDIYAQKFNFLGSRAWGGLGSAVCSAVASQSTPRAVPDGLGGIIAAWSDSRAIDTNIYAQRMRSNGAAQWTSDGELICGATNTQFGPEMVSDDSGGAIIAWRDVRNGLDNDVYARRIDANGSPLWLFDGIPIATGGGHQDSAVLLADGSGGAYVVWESDLSGTEDLLAQRLDLDGNRYWSFNGVSVSDMAFSQFDAAMALDGSGSPIIGWNDARNSGNPTIPDIYAQRIESGFGTWGHPEPGIASVADIPSDEGGFVAVNWDASQHDDFVVDGITHYSIWRATDAVAKSGNDVLVLSDPSSIPADFDGKAVWSQGNNKSAFYWEWLANQDAIRQPGYSYAAATRADSILGDDALHYFQVVSHSGNFFYASDEASGYSVDNLAPAAPMNFMGEASYAPSGLILSWDPNVEPDLLGYKIYRDSDPNFTPGPGNLLFSPEDIMEFDADWLLQSGFHYKLSAIDIHGNESDHVTLSLDAVVDAPSSPARLALHQNTPNPFNPSTTLSFELAASGPVQLRIYDLAGRLVLTLLDEERAAGEHGVMWHGRDALGRAVSSGVYLYEMRSGGQRLMKRMVLVK